jgi:hypothetical protein
MSINGAHYPTGSSMMAWMAEHQGKMGAIIENGMQESTNRLSTMEDLGKLKNDLEAAKASGDYSEVIKEAKAMLASHEGTEEAADLHAALDPLLAEEAKRTSVGIPTPLGQPLAYDTTGMTYASRMSTATDLCMKKLDTLNSALGKEDAIAMVALNDASSRYNQAMTLTSNLLAAMSSAVNGVIGNTRG